METLIRSTLFMSAIYLCLATDAQNPKTNSGKIVINNQNRRLDSTMNSNSNNFLGDSVKVKSKRNFGLIQAGLIIGISDGEFKKVSNGDVSIGFGFTCMYNFMGTDNDAKSPVNVFLGGSFEYLYFGGKSDHFYKDYNYSMDNKITTSVNLNVYSLLIVSRIEFFNFMIKPFIEGAAGGRLFNGVHKLTIDYIDKSGYSNITLPPSNVIRKGLADDIVGTFGYGGGFLFEFSKNARMEMKLMYMKGTTATYVNNETVKIISAGIIKYDTQTSTTDMFIPQIGISGIF